LRRLALIGIAALCCHSALAADLILGPQPEARRAAIEPVRVAERGRITIMQENDALTFSPTDRWYTQGFALNYLSAPIDGPAFEWLFPTTWLTPNAPRTRRFDVTIGQSIFTPADLRRNPPDPADRPYAGWLYAGLGWYQETNRRVLDHLELQIGVIGPASLAREVQTGYHTLIPNQVAPQGWGYQLKNEPGVVLSYVHKWRIGAPIGAGLSVDFIPEFGGSLGNVLTYGQVGGMLRLGRNLNVDYGPARIRPALSGTTWFDPSQLDGALGWYLFVGAQGRAVGRNIFLDGNTFMTSPSVSKNVFVGDFSAGASVFWLDYAKLDFVLTYRTKEFVGQPDNFWYGGVNISFRTL
jgi:lipid A 3-O-deacylase